MNERCEKHGVTRCVACTPRGTVGPVLAVMPPVDIEAMFDVEAAADSGPAVPPKLDQQQLEAIERQKEINAARTGVLEMPAAVSVEQITLGASLVVITAQKYAQAEIEVKAAELRGKKAREERDKAIEDYKQAVAERDRLKAELQNLVAN